MALGELRALLYPELRRLAHAKVRHLARAKLRRLARAKVRRSGDLTLLDTTCWVHESCLRFKKSGALVMGDRAPFMAYAARMMRSVVVDAVRSQQTECRGGDAEHVGLDKENAAAATDSRDSEVPRGHESLAALATIDARLVQVVEMRNFCGRTGPEIAEALGFAVRTVTRDWEKARLFPACLFALSPCKVNAELIQN